MDHFIDFKNKKMTKLKTFQFNSRLCQDYFKQASSASTQLNFNSTQTNSELGTTQLKLVSTYGHSATYKCPLSQIHTEDFIEKYQH